MRYVARIARGAQARGMRVIIATTVAGMAQPDLAALRDVTELIEYENPPGNSTRVLVNRQRDLSRIYRAFVRNHAADRVLVPFGDTVDKAFALFGTGGGAWDLLLMRAFFHHAAMGVKGASAGRGDVVRAWFFRRLLTRRGIRRVLTLDELLPLYAQRQGWRNAEKVQFVPDPPQIAPPAERDAARRRWGLSEGAPTILVYGALSLRKGLADLLAAVATDPDGALHLLLVGIQDYEAKPLLAMPEFDVLRRAGRLIEADRYVDETDEADAFAAADVVWLGYHDFQGSSGVLVQAAQADRPVVGCAEGLIGWRTREHGLGTVLRGRTSEDVRQAVVNALAQRDEPAARERRSTFANANSESAFLRVILDA